MVKKIKVKKILNEKQIKSLIGVQLPKDYFKKVIKEDIDVIDEDGKYLLRFRKNVLPKHNIEKAYNAMIKHANKISTARGVTGGNLENNKQKKTGYNNPVKSNIIGYFDTLTPSIKKIFNDANIPDKMPICRATAFTMYEREKWKDIIPLIKDIDKQYKKLFPKEHKKQHTENQKTKFKIDNTAFSTITLNLNLQTACHYDKGDFTEGYGNLIVLEKGKYKGGYTGFPEYGIAVDVREGDFLGMNVHKLHGNEPIEYLTKDAKRLSLVSYLRDNIPKKCKNTDILDYKYFDKIKLTAKQNNLKRKNKKTKKNII